MKPGLATGCHPQHQWALVITELARQDHQRSWEGTQAPQQGQTRGAEGQHPFFSAVAMNRSNEAASWKGRGYLTHTWNVRLDGKCWEGERKVQAQKNQDQGLTFPRSRQVKWSGVWSHHGWHTSQQESKSGMGVAIFDHIWNYILEMSTCKMQKLHWYFLRKPSKGTSAWLQSSFMITH